MTKRLIINTVALTVISVGATRVARADDVVDDSAPTRQACCSTIFTSAICCGSSCASGWFNCSAKA